MCYSLQLVYLLSVWEVPSSLPNILFELLSMQHCNVYERFCTWLARHETDDKLKALSEELDKYEREVSQLVHETDLLLALPRCVTFAAVD